MIKEFASRQFLAFLVTGGTAAMVNFGSRVVYSLWMEFSLAVIFAYVTGMITAFTLARLYVFRDSKRPVGSSAAVFVLVNLIAVAQTWTISMALAYYLLPYLGAKSHTREIAHAIGIAVPVFTSYIGHKRLSFR